jgi:hypothetical protein
VVESCRRYSRLSSRRAAQGERPAAEIRAAVNRREYESIDLEKQ